MKKRLPQEPILPFSAVVGLLLAKRALLLLAVDRSLKGVVIESAGAGTGKTSLVRAFKTLLPPEEQQRTRELPLSVTPDRLLGGIDLEQTLQRGTKVFQQGLLAEADGGFLYGDELNLLDASSLAPLLSALQEGCYQLEREGASLLLNSRLTLIGTYSSSEAPLPASVTSRVGLHVSLSPPENLSAAIDERIEPELRERVELELRERVELELRERMEVIENNAALLHSDRAQLDAFQTEDDILRVSILAARDRLASVEISNGQLGELAAAALALGVEGNSADIFAAKCAIANAALDGRAAVSKVDLELAIKLVLLPRATQLPPPAEPPDVQEEPPQQPQAEQPSDAPQNETAENNAPQEKTPQDDTPQSETSQSGDDSQNERANEPEIESPQEEKISLEELVMDALQTDVPESILHLSHKAGRKSASGSRGEQFNLKRGRHIRSISADAARGRIDLLATIQTALPFQRLRQTTDVRRKRAGGISIKKSDVRIKQYRDKAGALFIFIVDASGSMALNRMRQAKGAVAKLLQESYVHRDKVALIAFRGNGAQTLVPPTQSVERAKKLLDTMPTGGATPLASALYEGIRLAGEAKKLGSTQILFVLITDGKSNIALDKRDLQKDERKKIIEAELTALSALILNERIESVVIDTEMSFISKGAANALAKRLGGRYVYLPKMDAQKIADAVKSGITR